MSREIEDEEWELFRYSNDPFVNEGAVEVGRRLVSHGVARIANRAVVATAPPEQVLPKLRAELFGGNGIITNTHRRTSRAYHVNALANGTLPQSESDDVSPDWLGEQEGQISIPAPTAPFPDRDDDATIFDENELTNDALEDLGLDPSLISRDEGGAYSLHPAYLGPPGQAGFSAALKRAKAYFNSFEEILVSDDEYHSETTCMSCGSTLPNWTWESENGEKTKLEYGQSFTPMAGKSGRLQPLGQKRSLNSYYRGRCPACLIAGFYYMLMPVKPVANTGDTGVYRVHCVMGDFKGVAAVRRAYEQTVAFADLATPTSRGTVRLSSISVRSASEEVQFLAFFGMLLKALSEESVEKSDQLFADGGEDSPSLSKAVSFQTKPFKGPNVVRDMSGFEDAPVSVVVYERLKERTQKTNDEIESYSPYEDVLAWYIEIRNPSIDAEIGIDAKRDLARGILTGDLALLERGVFGLLKQITGDASAPYRMAISRHQHYFDAIMRDIATTIDDETQNSIMNAGRSIGSMFAERDDISVLQSFKHANTPDQFLDALERAGMGAVKKSHDPDNQEAHSTWVANSTVSELIGAISDEETFEAAKQMFVIHASLSAHYQNSTATNNGDQ